MYDHYTYTRCLTKHWFDFYTTDTKFPDVCNFIRKKIFHSKSLIGTRKSLNEIHEQNNKLIKGCEGASGLLNKVNGSALIHWETCSPEIVREIL